MTWTIRHEGSPKSIDNISTEQVVEGLQDGHWEPTDELLTEDGSWVAIENHPRFAEVAAELEPPPPPSNEDESRVDMNALIDVTLVLLIFFILTTSYAALQKRLEAPSPGKDKDNLKVVHVKEAEQSMVSVKVLMENGQPVIHVEKEVVDPANLRKALARHVHPGKTILLLQHDDDVPHDLVVRVIDQAKGAGMDSVSLVVP